jgi:hypothetical protein
MRKLIFTVFVLTAFTSFNHVLSQGCVAVRSTGGFCTLGEHGVDSASKWQLTVNNRYYKSLKHYVGETYQAQRAALGN